MKIYCLDTSAYSKFKAGLAQVVDVITQCHSLKVPHRIGQLAVLCFLDK